MIHKILILSSIYLLTTNVIYSQSKIEFFDNAREIETNRYQDVKGTPYLYKEWRLANIIDTNDLIYENVRINYNGYTNNFEVRIDDWFIELDERFYKRIEVDLRDNSEKSENKNFQKAIFERFIHYSFKDRFTNIIYNGSSIKLIREFKTSLVDRKIHNVGKTIEVKYFVPIKKYYFLEKGNLTMIPFKKKAIIAYFGNKREIIDYLKEVKANKFSEKDMIKLLKFYEDL